MWVGLQISEEKIFIFGKKLVGPENDKEKKRNLWKKFVGRYLITAGTNFRHTFRKYLPDPPLVLLRSGDQSYWEKQNVAFPRHTSGVRDVTMKK